MMACVEFCGEYRKWRFWAILLGAGWAGTLVWAALR